jgi:hypothetical protein
MRRISFLAIALTLALNSSAREEFTRNFDKTLSLRPGEAVLLEHKLGNIAIHTHSSQEIVIHAQIRVSAPDTAQAREFAGRVEILLEPAASLAIRTRYPERPESMFGSHNISFSVHYDVTLPENSPLEVRNAFGSVTASGLKAGSVILTSHGDLSVRDCRGAQRLENAFARVQLSNNVGDVSIQTNNGAVDVSGVTGSLTVRNRFADVTVNRVSKDVEIANNNGAVSVTDAGGATDIKNSFGAVAVRGVHGDLIVNNGNGKVEAADVSGSADLKTTFADLRFSSIGRGVLVRANNSSVTGATVGGPASIKTSFGLVRATSIGGLLTVENNNGGVTASSARGARISTSFGPVFLEGISGPIHIQNQNGAVDAASNSRGNCQPIAIQTSFSPLRVHLPPEASYHVLAQTSFGKIRSDFPLRVAGALSAGEVDGVLGGGKCEMNLANRNGAIEILKADN